MSSSSLRSDYKVVYSFENPVALGCTVRSFTSYNIFFLFEPSMTLRI